MISGNSAFGRGRVAVIELILIFAALSAPAVRAGEVGVMPDVRHLALVIGNEDYDGDGKLRTGPSDMPPKGMLRDLANPCRDATLFKERLVASKWKSSEITYRCNVNAHDMRDLVDDFSNTIVNSTDTVGIIFFSGHGAQFSDAETPHNFIFGTGAKIDLDQAARSLKDHPKNTAFVVKQAVDLDYILRGLGTQQSNGVLIILDACRDNALYGKISDIDNSPTIKPIFSNEDIGGVVVAFSTASGLFSNDGPSRHSGFSAAWASMLAEKRELDDILNKLPDRLRDYYKFVHADPATLQTPAFAGRFRNRWCVWACKGESDTPSIDRPFEALVRAEIPPPLPNRPTSFRLASYSVSKPNSDVRPLAADLADQAAPTALAKAPDLHPPAVRPTPQQARVVFDLRSHPGGADLHPATPMSFDVFWCDGGDGADERETRANALAETIARKAEIRLKEVFAAPDSETNPGNEIVTSVRVRRLSQNGNMVEGNRFEGDVVLYSAGDNRAAAWGRTISQLSHGNTVPRAENKIISGYVSVYICRSPALDLVSTQAFLQIPDDGQRKPAARLLRRLADEVPQIKVSKGIETRSDGPSSTEVRFYFDEDRDNAIDTAMAIQDVLGRSVRIQFMPRLASAQSKGHMEIWLGLKDPPITMDSVAATHATPS